MNKGFILIIVLWQLFSHSTMADTLFVEDFQQGNTKAWKAQGRGIASVTVYSGNYSMHLTKKKSLITVVPVSGDQQVRVSMALAAASLEKFDKCYGEVSVDGGANWLTVIEIGEGDDDGVTFHTGDKEIEGRNMNLFIRFRSAGKDDSDYCWGDNVRVSRIDSSTVSSSSALGAEVLLDNELLTKGGGYKVPVRMSAYSRPEAATAPLHQFQGRLTFAPMASASYFETLRDDYDFVSLPGSKRKQLPAFAFEFVQTGGHLVPVERGTIASSHPDWEYILEPGRVWRNDNDRGFTRAALPFSLAEKNANCIHNGVLTFLFKDTGSISRVAYQISSETCTYLKFNMWGLADAKYDASPVSQFQAIIQAYQQELQYRLPTKAISALAEDYPGARPARFGDVSEVNPQDMTAFGFVIDGVHYVGGCETRHGRYPFCDVLDLPSYSTAKSVFAGLAMMRMEKKYPGFSQLAVANYVPECSGEQWDGVSFKHLLDMTTGNYDSPEAHVDENSTHSKSLFFPLSHAEKIRYSCNHYQRKSPPGEKWVYHSSDTYILGAAMNAALRKTQGDGADIYRDIVVNDLWRPLHLSPVTHSTRRTQDTSAQPFTGWGLTFHRDDIARIVRFLNADKPGMKVKGEMVDEALFNGALFDETLFAGAMQNHAQGRGLKAAADNLRYNNGFWALDVKRYLNCEKPTWVPFMSGYGGIVVAMMPNGTSYYHFSDSGSHRWISAAVESHNIRGYCQQ